MYVSIINCHRLPEEPTDWISKISQHEASHRTSDHATRLQEGLTGIYADPSRKLFYYEPDAFKSAHSGMLDTLTALSDQARAPNNAFVLLPDSMYLLAPHSLVLNGSETVDDDGRGASDTSGFLVEFGGLKRSGGFQRLRVRYDIDGHFHSAVVEQW